MNSGISAIPLPFTATSRNTSALLTHRDQVGWIQWTPSPPVNFH